jgi:hypothetical protein
MVDGTSGTEEVENYVGDFELAVHSDHIDIKIIYHSLNNRLRRHIKIS